LSPEAFDQEIGALFSSFVGKIFPEWDEQTHVTTVPYRAELPNYIAFDWGYTNPLAAVEFQIDAWDRVRVWRLHYRAFTRLEDHLAIMAAREQPPGYKVTLCFGDAADPEAAATVSRYLAPCLADSAAKENWREGIDLIRGFLRLREAGFENDDYGTPRYEPGLLVDHSCVDFISEMNGYKSKESRNGANVPEMGQKVQDHAIDALRYGLMHLFKLGAQHHLSEVYTIDDLVTSSGDPIFTWNGAA
jgi:hypothetical protein